jgi:hypothetical protein
MTQSRLAPTYLDKFAFDDKSDLPNTYRECEWRGKIKSSTNNTRFKIKFYGEIFKKSFKGDVLSEHGLIGNTDFSSSLVYAIDIISGEQILLFDGCKHGYDALFCDIYTQEQIGNRPLTSFYTDNNKLDIFEVEIKVCHNKDYQDEFGNEIEEKGGLETIHGEIITLETLNRDGYDYFELILTNANGNEIVALAQELA